MTTARSNSTPPRDPDESVGTAWPVLARIPDVSAAARAAAPRRPQPAASASSTTHRIDPEQRRGNPPDSPASTAAEPARIDHSAHAPKPPAHHLRRRVITASPEESPPAVSPVLPSWDPFRIPGSRLPDSFAPILSFLVLVALFTAAGTSLLMLRSSQRSGDAEASRPAAARGERSIAGPTAAGPRSLGDVRLEPSPPAAPTAATISPTTAPPLTPSPNDAAERDAADVKPTVPVTAAPDDSDFPSIGYPSPVFPETFPKASERPLPRAQMTEKPAAVARFSGGIQEAQPRQAQHDDQSILH